TFRSTVPASRHQFLSLWPKALLLHGLYRTQSAIISPRQLRLACRVIQVIPQQLVQPQPHRRRVPAPRLFLLLRLLQRRLVAQCLLLPPQVRTMATRSRTRAAPCSRSQLLRHHRVVVLRPSLPASSAVPTTTFFPMAPAP